MSVVLLLFSSLTFMEWTVHRITKVRLYSYEGLDNKAGSRIRSTPVFCRVPNFDLDDWQAMIQQDLTAKGHALHLLKVILLIDNEGRGLYWAVRTDG